MSVVHAQEKDDSARFAFGENWSNFLEWVGESEILQAEDSLKQALGVDTLAGLRFLDAGSGSGLFSLAAARLGAEVHSFDFDPQSVATTLEMKRKFLAEADHWVIEQGSVLDHGFLEQLGTFDVVYSWGVLHHTGDMQNAFVGIHGLVRDGGALFIAIYNDQGWVSRYWTAVKRFYNTGVLGKALMVVLHAPYLVGARWIVRRVSGRRLLDRGMSYWHDMLDWVGGYPFEVAKPETVFEWFHHRGYGLRWLKTCAGRMGCNEFVFIKGSACHSPEGTT